ncbi:MAG: hypothetical protein WCT12_33690 [Verrucomicrobiota bacterium]
MTSRPSPVRLRDEPVSLRRLSRRFAAVGVDISAGRPREIAAGDPTTDDELVDVSFALVATATLAEDRRAQHGRSRRRVLRWLMVAGGACLAVSVVLLVFFLITRAFTTGGLIGLLGGMALLTPVAWYFGTPPKSSGQGTGDKP